MAGGVFLGSAFGDRAPPFKTIGGTRPPGALIPLGTETRSAGDPLPVEEYFPFFAFEFHYHAAALQFKQFDAFDGVPDIDDGAVSC